jgi:3-dehydroquinate synthase
MKQSTFFLYGPPGAGKSTIGQHLAQNLGLPFNDLDVNIERHSGKPIWKIFAEEGEAGFRQHEKAALRQAAAGQDGVIALGGGSLLDPENRALVETCGTVVLLNAPAETLAERVRSGGNPRPLLEGDTRTNLAGLLAARAAHYASFAWQLETAALAPQQAAWEIQVQAGMFRVQNAASSGGSGANSAYDVRIQAGGLDRVGELLAQRGLRGPMVIVSDTHAGPLYASRVADSLRKAGYDAHITLIHAGEQHKTISTVASLWEAFLSHGLERGSTVIALGGGVVSDLAGFAAATYLRGVRWVTLPTSLLAMVDASLGGKTGFDLPQGKNLAGAFHSPSLVLADPEVLTTLPDAERRSGLAEVVKHGVIADPALFALCTGLVNDGTAEFAEIVRRSVAVKVQVIETDPFEKGLRAVLNLGHTVGHAVELVSNYSLRHGEAVAIGMVVEASMAEQVGMADAGLAEAIAANLRHLGLPTAIPPHLDAQAILNAMQVDKKRAGGKVRFALPVRIGEVKYGIEVDESRRKYALGLDLTRT